MPIQVGIDEAGRGPLAGPVVAACVFLKESSPIIARLDDSKKLSAKKRSELSAIIKEECSDYSIKLIDAQEIDKINILQATLKAMKMSALEVYSKIPFDEALIDGNKTIVGDTVFAQKAVVKGDSIYPSIMAASILAKVYRDELMDEYHNKYPGYGFSQHKGYGTKAHLEAIKSIGPCPIHRLSFAPFKNKEL